jgi:hypothetical protein
MIYFSRRNDPVRGFTSSLGASGTYPIRCFQPLLSTGSAFVKRPRPAILWSESSEYHWFSSPSKTTISHDATTDDLERGYVADPRSAGAELF